MSETTTPQNLYETLHVSPRACSQVIKAAYVSLMQLHHPDRGGRQDIAARINTAYDLLSDPKHREEYNRELRGTGKTIGPYKILEKISEGGMAATYKAEHTGIHGLVCIKHNLQISPEYNKILTDEARAIWDLRHYALPAIRDLLELPDGSMAVVMSYIPGKTLEQEVQAHAGKLLPEHVAWISSRCLDALRYLHLNGIVHGDVKPQNIIVQPAQHTAVLVDYGLAAVRPTSQDQPIGYTKLYASPEHLAGLPLIPETDLYCLGLTMIRALGGDVKKREVPASTPDPLKQFIRTLIVHNALDRPNWEKTDLFEDFAQAREKSFGRKRSNMLQL